MKAYISGPIATEIPGTTRESRKETFNKCTKWIRECLPTWEVVNPLEVEACIAPDAPVKCDEGLENIQTHSWACYLRYDLIAMLSCNAIVLLPGWEKSPGAQLEAHVARLLAFHPFIANDKGEIEL